MGAVSLLQEKSNPSEAEIRSCPLRHQPTLASCRSGGHAIWWTVEAATETDALGLLPTYVAERTTATSVSEVQIP